MTRQYRIMWKRAGAKAWATLTPYVNAGLYDKPEVKQGIELVRDNPAFVAICVQVGDELFNIITFSQEAIAPQAFTFET